MILFGFFEVHWCPPFAATAVSDVVGVDLGGFFFGRVGEPLDQLVQLYIQSMATG